ncbi:hypothetical protein AB0E69_19280 [Kribbella sp. NPDC026611]|uniref:hypothetical protein n=1 Tax=Kribbella sp. NPDC026611 TaxID=3154911 RepID=UPI0033D1FD65
MAAPSDRQARAQLALGLALGLVAPGAIAVSDGRVRLPDAREYLGRRILRRFGKRLARRADEASDQRLIVEAVALLGAEIQRSRGGVPADGATRALDDLLDRPGLSASMRTDSQALLRSVLEGGPQLSESGLERVLSSRPQARAGAPLIDDSIASAQSIRSQAEALTPPSPERSVPANQPAPTGFLATYRRLREARHARGRERYVEFRRLTREWEETRQGRGTRDLRAVRAELVELRRVITRSGLEPPALPWRHQQVAEPVPAVPMSPQERLLADVQSQITGLENIAALHAQRATVRAASAQKARDDARDTLELARVQATRPDQSAFYRSWTLSRRSENLQNQATRHDTIAELSRTAAQQATEAAEAYRALLNSRPSDLATLLDDAEQKVQQLAAATAATAPRADVQHTGHPYGRLPHLTALARDLNEALEHRRSTYRFTPDVLHRWLRAETHRLISPDGVVLTVPGDARDQGAKLIQFQLHLAPGELREVLGGGIVLDESRSGQLGQLAFVTGATASHGLSSDVGGGLKAVAAALPDSSPVKAIGEYAAPGVSLSSSHSETMTMGQQESPQPGQVEALYGELLLYRSTNPAYQWRIRGAGQDWSTTQTVAAGTANDTDTLDLAYSNTYTVPAPTETIVLDDLGLSLEDLQRERLLELPEHVGLRADGVDDLCDRTLAALRERGVVLDRTGTNELAGLIVEDGIAGLEETSRPGGVDAVITKGGRPVAYVRHESFPVIESAEPISTSSAEHSVEFWRVGNSATSASLGTADSTSRSASVGYAGPGLSDLAGSGIAAGPGASYGRKKGTQDTLSLAGLGSRWSTQRLGPTVAIRMRMERRVTVQLLDRDETFSVNGAGSADLRMLERDALRYGLPVAPEAVMRDPDGKPRRGIDGRLLLRGDPQPTTETLGLPVWLGDGPGQLRGAGPAMVRDLEGFSRTREQLYQKLYADGLIPQVDKHGRPVPADLAGREDAEVLSLLRNLKRVNVAFAKHRLETAYNHSTQIRTPPNGAPQPDGGVLFELTEHRSGHLAKMRTYRLTIEQDFSRAQLLGLSGTDTIANVDFAMDAVTRTRGYSKATPWSFNVGFGKTPDPGAAGVSPEVTAKFGRTAQGRAVSSSEGDEVYQMVLSESRDQVAVFKVPHTLMVSEVLPDGSSELLTSEEGSARIYLDSSMCHRGEPPTMSVPGAVDRDLLRGAAASIHHLDAHDPDGQVVRAVPELGRGDRSVLQHLASRLAVQNQMTRLELLTGEYRDDLIITPPDDALATLAHRGLAPRRSSLSFTAHVENVKYVSSGHQFIGMLNIPSANVSYTEGVSSGTSVGVSTGAKVQGGGGSSAGATVGTARVTSRSSKVTEGISDAAERSVLRTGEHYLFWGDLVLDAKLRSGGADARAIELDRGGIVVTIPEEHALAAYTQGKLELPTAKVADAVQRLLDGNLSLPRRTTSALLSRYAADPDRRSEHTDEQLKDLALRVAGLSPSLDPRLDEALAASTAITSQSVAISTPPGYANSMAWSVSDGPLRGHDGRVVDVLAETSAAIEEHLPGVLATDPLLAGALNGILGGERAAGQRDRMTDPLGYSRDLPIQTQGAPRDLKLRIRLEFTGPATVDGGDRNEGAASKSFNYRADWRLRSDSSSVTAATAYDASLDASGGNGSSGEVAASTELTTSMTATSSRTGYRVSPAAALKTEWAVRPYRLIIDITDEPRTPFGGRTRKDRLRPVRHTQRVVDGLMPVTIPSAHVDVPPPLAVGDHRVVTPPDSAVVESVQPHPAADTPRVNRFHEAIVARAGKRDMLTARGVAMHSEALKKLFGGSGLLTKAPEMIGPTGYTTPPFPLPHSTSEAVRITMRLDLHNSRIVSNPNVEQPVQLGENTRQTSAEKISLESNSELPTTYTVGGTDGGTGISASMSSSEQATTNDLSATGWRHEVGLLGTAQLVSVEFTANAHARYELLKNGRVVRSVDEHNIAQGAVTLGMSWAAYQGMLVEQEEGRRQQSDLSPAAVKVRRIHVTVDHDPRHPYQPLVDAAQHAVSAGVAVELTVRNQDGTKQQYSVTQEGDVAEGGFPDALVKLHPHLVQLAEGIPVDLHKVYLAAKDTGRFSGAVVAELHMNGVPASAIDGIDSRSVQSIRARVERDPSLEEAAQRGTGTGTDGVAIV